MKVKAVILAGGEGRRLGPLTMKRAKPAVPFAGKYRIIDFTLSNCVNSNVFNIYILAQYRPHSLIEHLGQGRPWDLDRSFTGGIHILQPYLGNQDTDWYAGTADAVTQNLNFVRRGYPDYVLILAGDHVYELDYSSLIDFHRESKADATVACIHVTPDDASRFGILEVANDQFISKFEEKPEKPSSTLASMGIYVFSYEMLEEALAADRYRTNSAHDFGRDIIPQMLEEGRRVAAYHYDGYWIDVGTIETYWEAHMHLLNSPPAINLNDRTWIIHTQSEERPPAQIAAGASIRNSMISEGAYVAKGAYVEQSVISPGVFIGPSAVVRESVIFNDTYIEQGAVIERSIIDKQVVIGTNSRVGSILELGELGISCIGKNTQVPASFRIARNVMLGTDLRESDFMHFENNFVPFGSSLGIKNLQKSNAMN